MIKDRINARIARSLVDDRRKVRLFLNRFWRVLCREFDRYEASSVVMVVWPPLRPDPSRPVRHSPEKGI